MKTITSIAAGLVDLNPPLRKQVCQDAVISQLFQVHDKEILALALSDGAGSALKGAESANLLTRSFIHLTEAWIQKPNKCKESIATVFKNIIESIHYLLTQHCENNNEPLADYHATFMAAWVLKMKENGKEVYYTLTFAIGDGIIIGFQEEMVGDKVILSLNDYSKIIKGQYENQTVFFTSTRWEEAALFTETKDCTGLFMSSDGLSNIFFDYRFQGEDETQTDPFKRWNWSLNLDENSIAKSFSLFCTNAMNQSFLDAILNDDNILLRNNDDKSIIIASYGSNLCDTTLESKTLNIEVLSKNEDLSKLVETVLEADSDDLKESNTRTTTSPTPPPLPTVNLDTHLSTEVAATESVDAPQETNLTPITAPQGSQTGDNGVKVHKGNASAKRKFAKRRKLKNNEVPNLPKSAPIREVNL